MLISEVQAPSIDSGKLAALSDFLSKRAQDTNAKKVISIQAFLALAQSLKIPLTGDQLRSLSKQSPLKNLIADVEGDDQTGRVIFRGEGGDVVPGTEMSVDQARATVDRMAKRALK